MGTPFQFEISGRFCDSWQIMGERGRVERLGQEAHELCIALHELARLNHELINLSRDAIGESRALLKRTEGPRFRPRSLDQAGADPVGGAPEASRDVWH